MAFSPMVFTKVWTNPVDFPTHETQEGQVRADIQFLFDEIKDQFNDFIGNELVAANLPIEETTDLPVENVQAALEYLVTQIQGLVLSELVIPNGSLTTEKYQDGSVTTAKIHDGAITTDKILDNAVTGDKIAPGSVNGASFQDSSIPEGKLGNSSVKSTNLKPNCVTHEKLATDAVEANNIKDGEVIRAKIANAAINSDKIDAGAVIEAKIGTGAVTEGKIGTGAVTTAKIGDLQVTNDKIKNATIAEGKLATALANKINGKQDPPTTTSVTLAAGAGPWSKSVSAISATSIVYASPKTEGTNGDRNFNQWTNSGVRPYTQGSGTIGFKARSATTQDCEVNLVIWN